MEGRSEVARGWGDRIYKYPTRNQPVTRHLARLNSYQSTTRQIVVSFNRLISLQCEYYTPTFLNLQSDLLQLN